MKIQHTKDYSKFAPNPFQRHFSPAKVKGIVTSLNQHGYIASKAISVYEKDGILVINTGHHRLEACKIAGVPVHYVIEAQWNLKTMVDEGTTGSSWPLVSAAQSFARQGSRDYQDLLNYADKGIPLTMAASLLGGEAAGSGNIRKNVLEGSFRIKDREKIDNIIGLIENFPHIIALKSRHFISEYSKCLLTPNFDRKIFFQRLRNSAGDFIKTRSSQQMLEQIEETYNYRSMNKIPLAFFVNENSKERHLSFGKGGKK